MSLASLEDARARVATDLGDPELQLIIDAEEAELAARIGPLTGEIEQSYSFELADQIDSLYLARPADPTTLVLEDPTGTAIAGGDLRLSWHNRRIQRAIGLFVGPALATYTPTDGAAVRRAIVDLVRIATTDPTVDSETIGSYTYRRATITMADLEAARERVYGRLLQRPPGIGRLGTIAIRSRTGTLAQLAGYED